MDTLTAHEPAQWTVATTLDKFRAADIEAAQREFGTELLTAADFREVGIDPFETLEREGNVLLNAGIQLLFNLLVGAGGTVYSQANARVGAGDGNGSVPTAAATDTGLAAPTNRYYQQCDTGFPTVGSVAPISATWRATFPTGQGNYAWNEWCIDNGGASSAAPAGTALNHKGVALGTKTNAAAWAFTVTVQIS